MSSGVPVIKKVHARDAGHATALRAKLTRQGVIVGSGASYVPLSVGSGTDPLRDQQWALDRLGVDSAHAAGFDGSGQTIAVIDTGIYPGQEDLTGQVIDSADFIDGVPGFRFHGTAVAGIMAANAGNGVGIEGIAPGAKLIDARVCTPTACDLSAVANGIVWAVGHGATVINLSLGSEMPDPALQAVLRWATAQGVVVVAAAGNSGCALVGWWGTDTNCTAAAVPANYPGAYPDVIGVGAVDSTDAVPTYSSYGPYVDIAGPAGVTTTAPPLYTQGFAGTSAASPHVAAVAALVREANPSLTPAQVQAVLEASASTPAVTPTHPVWVTPDGAVDTTSVTARSLVGAGIVDAMAATSLAASLGARPAAPSVEPGDGSLAVTWSPFDGASSYAVLVDGHTRAISVTPDGSATDLTDGAQYAVQVAALDADGATIAVSAPALATPDPPANLPAPTVVQATNDSSGITLRLAANSSWHVYQLSRVDTPSVVVATFRQGPNETTVSDSTYFQVDPSVDYQLVEVDGDGRVGPPATFTLARWASTLDAPTNFTVTPGDGSVTMQWDPVPGAVAYNLLDPATRNWDIVTDTSMEFTGLTNGKTYSAVVGPKSDTNPNTGIAGFSTRVVHFVPMPPPLPAPTNVHTTSSVSGITLTWDPVPGATGYNVYRDDGWGTSTGPGATLFDRYVDDLVSGHTYHYIVQPYRALDSYQFTDFGSMSDEVAGSLAAFPPPANFACDAFVSAQTVDCHFDPVDGVWGYYVDMSGPGYAHTWVTFSTDLTTSLPFVPGGTYTFRVRAEDRNQWRSTDLSLIHISEPTRPY